MVQKTLLRALRALQGAFFAADVRTHIGAVFEKYLCDRIKPCLISFNVY